MAGVRGVGKVGNSKVINDEKKGMLEASWFGYAFLEVGKEIYPKFPALLRCPHTDL